MRRYNNFVIPLIVGFWIQPAEACHRYSRWHYPWKQTCTVTALAPRTRLPHARIDVAAPPLKPASIAVKKVDMPLPDLTAPQGGEPDEEMRMRLILRARAEPL
jgi:hypothetical protein